MIKKTSSNITIKKNAKPDLDICEMLCDKGLNPKLDKYELTKFINAHTSNLLLGRPGSGKTSLLYSLFKKPLKKCFHTIYLFQPSTSRASMKDKLFDKLPDDQKYEELNFDNLEEVLSRIESSEDENHCIIMDDCGSALKDPACLKMLKQIFQNRRHLHVSIYFLCQTYYSVPKDLRKLFNNLFVFKVAKNELLSIFDELVESKAKYILDISKTVFDNVYNFLFMNVDSQRIFKNWDELIFSEE